MISSTDSKWRAVRLRDAASVEYLNRLLSEGWHLMRLEVDGLEYLGFEVPVDPPTWTTARSIHTQVDAARLPHIVVIVLRHGDRPGLQRAVHMERDETGHFDLGTIRFEEEGWGFFTSVLLEDGNRVVIVEQDGRPGMSWWGRR